MDKATNDRVIEWLKTRPGAVFGSSPHDVLARGWGQCTQTGVQCSLPEFGDILARCGIKPDQRGPRWVLVLPSDPTGGADPVRHRRLHNLTGRV